VGLVRTALFNWAYARHHGGTFVFRIEDTDAARDSEESYQQLLAALSWLGLNWDEGVGVGGPNEPYRQSERSSIYDDVIQKLKDAGHIYESFATGEEIEARNVSLGRDPKMGYDNFERDHTDEIRATYRAEGREPALRLRVPDVDLSFTDLVRGEITFPAGSFSDFVVVRPNGKPLYTLVNPVDDALMNITHVLRGEDLLSSTPRQIALYLALIDIGVAIAIPQFGHLPYVMGESSKKLSKRDPEANLFHHKDRGFIPEGLINYLSLLGWSLSHDRDVFSIDEMVQKFDVVDVNPNPARFDQKKADSINADHIRLLEPEDFARRIIPYLIEADVLVGQPSEEELSVINEVAPLVQSRVTVLSEAAGMMGFFFTATDELEYEEDALKSLPENTPEVLTRSIEVLTKLTDAEWQTDIIQNALANELIEKMQLKPRIAYGPLRVAISGRRVSPPLFESLQVLGRDQSLLRLKKLNER
jgi:glutamyl-tRNA synthetase